VYTVIAAGNFDYSDYFDNKNLRYREEHSASVLFRWSTLSHLLGENLLMANQPLSRNGLRKLPNWAVPLATRIGLVLVGVAVRIGLGFWVIIRLRITFSVKIVLLFLHFRTFTFLHLSLFWLVGLQSTAVSLCGLTVKKRFHQPPD